MHRKTAGALVAAVLALGVLASAILAARQIQADTVVPGFATAHINLEITVCDTPELELEAKFTPPTGKRYYFKKRAFPLSPGLNTIEWYIRKIPAGQYKLTISPQEGLPLPESEEIYLASDKVNDRKTFSVYICEPAISEPAAEPTAEPILPDASEPHDPYPYPATYTPDPYSSGLDTSGTDSTLNLPIAPGNSACSSHYTVSCYDTKNHQSVKNIPCSSNQDCHHDLMIAYCNPHGVNFLECIGAQYYCDKDGLCKGCDCPA